MVVKKRGKNETRRRNVFRRFLTRVLIVSFGLVLVQRLSGAGGVIQYSVTLFQLSGAAVDPDAACIVVGAFQLAASGASFLLVDRVGRRTLLLVSSAVVTACLVLLVVYFGLLETGDGQYRFDPIVRGRNEIASHDPTRGPRDSLCFSPPGVRPRPRSNLSIQSTFVSSEFAISSTKLKSRV